MAWSTDGGGAGLQQLLISQQCFNRNYIDGEFVVTTTGTIGATATAPLPVAALSGDQGTVRALSGHCQQVLDT